MTGRHFIALVLCIVGTLGFLACSGPAPSDSATPANSSPPVYEGYHDITNCNGIMGWALDKNRPNDPIKVDLYDGDKVLDTVTADNFRQDLLDNGKGNGKHSFTYILPPFLKDGKPHVIRMKFAGTNTDLTNTSKEITCVFQQPAK